jgi:hypothetical protein
MSLENAVFMTTRKKVVELYADTGKKFRATTKPYKSTRPLIFDIVKSFNNTMAHAIARAGQELVFFNYGQGDSVTDGFGATLKPPQSWTNQLTASSTNGGNDMIVEGFSASAKGVRVQWPRGTYLTVDPAPGTDPDLLTAYEGATAGGSQTVVELGDPAALMSPPQLDSPFNLRRLLMDVCAPSLVLTFSFDEERTDKVGTLDELPEGGAKSYLMANGDPRTDNRYRIPEGYWWRRKGEVDSNFQIAARLTEPLVVPITLVGLFGTVQTPALIIPKALALDITIRVHGLQLRVEGQN